MAIKLPKNEGLFRNELIFAVDAKAINMDTVLINLFMLMSQDQRVNVNSKVKNLDINTLLGLFEQLEDEGEIEGVKEHPEALQSWLRCNLINLVNRGKPDREKVSSVRPLHLEAYRIRSPRQARDYNTADQLSIMLGVDLSLKNELRSFLSEYWSKNNNEILSSENLDVDSLAVLKLIKRIQNKSTNPPQINSKTPLLPEQAKLFCEDIRKLLAYKRHIPRTVLLEYLKILSGFHLSLYLHKLIKLLPKMTEQGSSKVEDDWSVVADMTGNLNSRISQFAIEDGEKTVNGLYNYIYSTFQINVTRDSEMSQDNMNIETALQRLKNNRQEIDAFCNYALIGVKRQNDEEANIKIDEITQYSNSNHEKYLELLMHIRGNYQLKYYMYFIDNAAMKNTDSGFLAAGRTKKNPRRYVIGSKLLELLVQILLLEVKGDKFVVQPITIDELMHKIRERYGIIINGLNEERFKNSDLNTQLAFKENTEAFKETLREIGFYTDLSDAYLLQKVRPRYEID